MRGYDYASVDENRQPDCAKTGASFVIVRGAYPYQTGMLTDAHLGRDRDVWHAAGVTLGSYVILSYNGHGPSPEDQIATFHAAYGARRPGELPPWLDVEFPFGRAATGLTAPQALTWIERAYDALVKIYGVVGTYTSARVWHEDLDDLPSKLGSGPLWIKVPYTWKARQAPHDFEPVTGTLPVPWRRGGPGCWIVQGQGDAIGVPGFSSTVDCNLWVPSKPTWATEMMGGVTVQRFQELRGLEPDGIIGPRTFAAMTV